MKKFFILSLLLVTVGIMSSVSAQSKAEIMSYNKRHAIKKHRVHSKADPMPKDITIKIDKSYKGARNAKLILLATEESDAGPMTIKLGAIPVEGPENFKYVMTAPENIKNLLNELNDGIHFRVFYQDAAPDRLKPSTKGDVGHFSKACLEDEGGKYVITVAGIGERCDD